MSLRDIYLKKVYSSSKDNILKDFYIPILSESTTYKRIAGFFSSTSLTIAAKGILNLIENNGTMQLIVSPKLNQDDLITIKNYYENPEDFIEKIMLKELDNFYDEFSKNHIFALGWMLSKNKLEIKVAIPSHEVLNYYDSLEVIAKTAIFHQKIGILIDSQENIISFSGSINETENGWLNNIEEFKVFRSWENNELEYLYNDLENFSEFWNGNSKNVKICSLPEAIKNKMIDISPNEISKIKIDYSNSFHKPIIKKISLHPHQKIAISKWFENNCMGILEMATGTGKTFTALGCLEELLNKNKNFISVISCPYGHLIKQWKEEIKKFGINITSVVADGTNKNWRKEIYSKLYDIKNNIYNNLIILTTHNTLSSEDFLNCIKNFKLDYLLIADEVHGLGAPQRKKALIKEYNYRLGLSATPKRWLDPEGTKEIIDFFNDTIYEFSLADAIKTRNPDTGETYLTPYMYKPVFTNLTDDELLLYEEMTKKIVKAYHKTKDDKEKYNLLTLLLIKRQAIIKNADNKIMKLNEILKELPEIKYCLIYCEPQQLKLVQDILNTFGDKTIKHHKFTGIEGLTPNKKFNDLSEREFYLKSLAEGSYDVLVAMKCLDEGVDVPQAKIAIILSSSGNPRQFIQRRGRVLRRFPGKDKAIIYDLIVIPPKSIVHDELFDLERKIIEKELLRYKEFARTSINYFECLTLIEEIENLFNIYI